MMKMNRLPILYFGILLALISCSSNKTVDPLGQFDADVAAIDKYLATNSITANHDARGIRFVINTLGTGLPPRQDQNVRVKFTGRLLSNGTVFDQGTVQGGLTNYIDGWQIGIPLFPKGTKSTLYIPSNFGYGSTGNQALGVPANSNLVYEMELIDVLVAQTEKDQLAADIVTIDNYLKSKSITAISDTTGLRYVVTQIGTGTNKATWYNKVKFAYSGRILSTEVQFTTGIALQSATFDSRVVDYITGFQIGLQKMKLSSKMTFYIPSTLAFGAKASSTVPANANLIYELELQEIIQ